MTHYDAENIDSIDYDGTKKSVFKPKYASGELEYKMDQYIKRKLFKKAASSNQENHPDASSVEKVGTYVVNGTLAYFDGVGWKLHPDSKEYIEISGAALKASPRWRHIKIKPQKYWWILAIQGPSLRINYTVTAGSEFSQEDVFKARQNFRDTYREEGHIVMIQRLNPIPAAKPDDQVPEDEEV